jgi:hypothetical protein
VSFSRSFVPVIVLTTIFALGLCVSALRGSDAHLGPGALLWTLEYRILLASWVNLDRKARAVPLPFEFDAFVFFAWPIAVPYYFYRSRRKHWLAAAFGVWGLYVVPNMIASAIRVVVTMHR